MRKLFSYAALTAGLLAVPALASAGDLSLTIVDGRVTLVAQDVTVRQILAEWARIGQTKIVNADKLIGPPLTLELRDVPEAKPSKPSCAPPPATSSRRGWPAGPALRISTAS